MNLEIQVDRNYPRKRPLRFNWTTSAILIDKKKHKELMRSFCIMSTEYISNYICTLLYKMLLKPVLGGFFRMSSSAKRGKIKWERRYTSSEFSQEPQLSQMDVSILGTLFQCDFAIRMLLRPKVQSHND